ncbi:MAG: GFA family protein [Cocleimonas sp.]
MPKLTGSCLCGEVAYSINGEARDIVNCFCSQCRKTSGHYLAATRVNKDDLKIEKNKTLSWYECLPNVFRGFCNQCGGNLFWDNGIDNEISIMAGTLDTPTNLKTIGNIYTKDASDYCVIPNLQELD